MILGIDFIDNTLDDTFFIDDKSSAERSHISTAVQLFFGPYAECLIERRIGIGNQIERQRLFLDKFPDGKPRRLYLLLQLRNRLHATRHIRCVNCMPRLYNPTYCLWDKNTTPLYEPL